MANYFPGRDLQLVTLKMSHGCSASLTNVPIGVFCIGKIRGGQDRAFQFRDSLVNYKAHDDVFWFRPLLSGNSPTFSGLILKMNM
jgi:hypothetical protein